MMFICYVCSAQFAVFGEFRTHVNMHTWRCQLIMPILCRQGDCCSTFTKPFNLFRHIQQYHSSDGDCKNNADHITTHVEENRTAVSSARSDEVNGSTVENNIVNDIMACEATSLSNVALEGLTLVASLRANSSIPYSIIPPIIETFNEMTTSLVETCHMESMKCFLECSGDVSESMRNKFADKLKECTDSYKKPLGFLDSKYKQDTYFAKHKLFVSPQAVNFGVRLDTRLAQSRLVYDDFQYVSVEKTVRSLLQNEQYVRRLLHAMQALSPADVISHYRDGEQYKLHKLFSDKTKISLMIQLFYDGMGTTNPLRGQSTLCNMGVFYFVIKNLPDAWNTCFANVHLLALCYEEDIAVNGFSAILNKFTSEIRHLASDGFSGDFPVIGHQQIFVSLCQVTCDNLALNSLFGFVKSFSGDFFCTICYATHDSIQHSFSEDDFTLRTKAEYDKDVKRRATQEQRKEVHARGIKRACELNNIDGYHITENYTNDIMHTLLEGVVPLEMGCVLYTLITDKHLFTIDDLNDQVIRFWQVINVDKKCKPPELGRIVTLGAGLSKSMKATQCWALLKYLPLIIGHKVPDGDEHWDFLLHLSDLVDLIFARNFTVGMVSYLKQFIADHLKMFVRLFGDTVTIKPKQHFLVHLPTIVLKSGPLVGMSCLKYELKNSFFKRSSHIVCNFMNISKTLAYRHQNYALYSNLSNAHSRDVVVVGRNGTISMECWTIVCRFFNIQTRPEVNVVENLRVDSVAYKKGLFFVIASDEDTDDPIFGAAECFVSLAGVNKWHIVVHKYHTIAFIPHLHSYLIDDVKPALYDVLPLCKLVDHHAVCCYERIQNRFKFMYVRLQHHVSQY